MILRGEQGTSNSFDVGEITGGKRTEPVRFEIFQGNSSNQVIFQFIKGAHDPGLQSSASGFDDLLDIHDFPH